MAHLIQLFNGEEINGISSPGGETMEFYVIWKILPILLSKPGVIQVI